MDTARYQVSKKNQWNKFKNISLKMLKDEGMVVLKIKKQDCNNPSGAQWTIDYDIND